MIIKSYIYFNAVHISQNKTFNTQFDILILISLISLKLVIIKIYNNYNSY
jgi:hypothetical protein